jgi:dihydrofolate synthase/folylpolyglutamate synthase
VGGRLVDIETPRRAYRDVLVSLHGPHQGVNAACGVAAAEAFFARPLEREVVEDALSSVQVPGRLEVLGRQPLVIVDGAHNVAAMAALAAALEEGFSVPGPAVAVVGLLAGRDPEAMLSALGPARIRTLVACAPSSPRALPAEEVATAGWGLGLDAVTAGSVPEALDVALGSVPEDGMVVVTGSLYLVGEARARLLGRAGGR